MITACEENANLKIEYPKQYQNTSILAPNSTLHSHLPYPILPRVGFFSFHKAKPYSEVLSLTVMAVEIVVHNIAALCF